MLKDLLGDFQADVTESFTCALIEDPLFVGPVRTIVETATSILPKALRLAKERRPQSDTLHNQDAMLAGVSNIVARAGYDIVVSTEPRAVVANAIYLAFRTKILMTSDNLTT